MSVHPKLVAVLGLLQFLFIAIGFGVTRSFLHLYDQVIPEVWGKYVRPIPGFLAFIRDFGLWFVLVPITWSLLAAANGENSHGLVSVPQRYFVAGIVLTVILAALFSLCALGSIRMFL